MKPPRLIVHAPKPKPKRPKPPPQPPMKAAVIVDARSPQQISRAKRYENRWVKTLMKGD